MSTVAIHVISTTHGTWLPGDPRGHWSPLFDFYGKLIQRGHRLNLPDPATMERAQSLMTDPPKTLDVVEQMVVGSIVAGLVESAYSPGLGRGGSSQTSTVDKPETAAGRGITPAKAGAICRPPKCLAAAIEPTHAHLLFGPVDESLERFVGRIKGTSSSALLKLPHNRERKHTWTASFWRVFIYEPEVVPIVREYIEAHNVERGLPARRFGFVI